MVSRAAKSIPSFGGRLAPGVAASPPPPPPVRLTLIFDTQRSVSAALTSHKVTLYGSDSGQQLRMCGGTEAQSSFQKPFRNREVEQQQQQQTTDRRERLRNDRYPQMLFFSHSLFMSSHRSRGQHSTAKLRASFKKKKKTLPQNLWLNRAVTRAAAIRCKFTFYGQKTTNESGFISATPQ